MRGYRCNTVGCTCPLPLANSSVPLAHPHQITEADLGPDVERLGKDVRIEHLAMRAAGCWNWGGSLCAVIARLPSCGSTGLLAGESPLGAQAIGCQGSMGFCDGAADLPISPDFRA